MVYWLQQHFRRASQHMSRSLDSLRSLESAAHPRSSTNPISPVENKTSMNPPYLNPSSFETIIPPQMLTPWSGWRPQPFYPLDAGDPSTSHPTDRPFQQILVDTPRSVGRHLYAGVSRSSLNDSFILLSRIDTHSFNKVFSGGSLAVLPRLPTF